MVKATDVPLVSLNNGVPMPQLGLGVWQAEAGQEAEQATATALQSGYRLIDTAKIYGNEQSVGQAIRNSGMPREQLFITTKLWNSDQGYDSTLRAFDSSLNALGLDYVDLYLIHWPVPSQNKYVETWRALRQLYSDKRVRAIGVSNFQTHHLDELLQSGVVPAVNQVELHPHLQQTELRAYCHTNGIQVESYSPLKRAGDLFADPTIKDLANKHSKTPAQIILRWHIQENLVVIPKSVTPERIQENINIFDFALDGDDMAAIQKLDQDKRISSHPDHM